MDTLTCNRRRYTSEQGIRALEIESGQNDAKTLTLVAASIIPRLTLIELACPS